MDYMQELNLPKYQFSTSITEGKVKIFDRIRKKKVALTPEEWVRQNFIAFLIEEKGFPASLIAIEAKVNVNGLSQRADIVVYNRLGQAIFIVECKAPSVKITQDTFAQACRYNIILQTRVICVTNGLNHYCALLDSSGTQYNFLEEIPLYDQLKTR
ncbi:type I restriction enzyme HsdR N-terminal domain-containing protein [Labilibacter marinus]|uniref:type I restriction enzyme HsdR N-terminal domain-containing protein n=1 Tax=Labilibacter marinus TaxID=1477105 RepID=UPI001E5256F8|nr:type I restriction enzyme HsdR N-terminal domain-containing protein [Labilibacter marinus]